MEIWQEARVLAKHVIKIAKTTELENNYRLKNQICASSGSVMDNIAEGFERGGNREFRQFLSIAKGSAGETRSQTYRLYDWEYIDEAEMTELTNNYKKLSGKISNFMGYLSKTEIKGIKYKG